MNDMRELQRENESLAARLSHMEAENLVNQTKEINGVQLVVSKVNNADMNSLRAMVDDLKQN